MKSFGFQSRGKRERERARESGAGSKEDGHLFLLLLLLLFQTTDLSSLKAVGRMYTAGLNPFYASNFSLWSAYCAAAAAGGGGFAVDTVKKPSFCIADILQAGGDAENIPGSSALMVHMGHQQQQQQQLHRGQQAHSPLRPSPVGPDPSSVYGPRLSPTSPYHHHHNNHHHQHHQHQHLSRSHGLQLTSVPRTALGSQQAPLPPSSKDLKFGIDRILSVDFEPKGREMKSSLRGETFVVVAVSSSV